LWLTRRRFVWRCRVTLSPEPVFPLIRRAIKRSTTSLGPEPSVVIVFDGRTLDNSLVAVSDGSESWAGEQAWLDEALPLI